MEKFSWDSRVKWRTTCSSDTSGSGGGVAAEKRRRQVVTDGSHGRRLGGRAPPGPALVEDQGFTHHAATATPSTPASARR